MCNANSVGTGRDLSVSRMVITNGNYIMANVTANRGFKITIGIGGLRRDGSRVRTGRDLSLRNGNRGLQSEFINHDDTNLQIMVCNLNLQSRLHHNYNSVGTGRDLSVARMKTAYGNYVWKSRWKPRRGQVATCPYGICNRGSIC